jgi:hypothetical protein
VILTVTRYELVSKDMASYHVPRMTKENHKNISGGLGFPGRVSEPETLEI